MKDPQLQHARPVLVDLERVTIRQPHLGHPMTCFHHVQGQSWSGKRLQNTVKTATNEQIVHCEHFVGLKRMGR
jgi:hypothetical protein